MFTGLVRDIGTVRSIAREGDWLITIQTALPLAEIATGASIACSGICLTVVDKGNDWFAVQVSQETLSKTAIGEWREGTKINLEQSLRMGDELGGHFVFGHVDGLAKLTAIRESGGSHILTFEVSPELSAALAPKGSVSLDGVSLTVNEVKGRNFNVNIIPHTWTHTTFGARKTGESLHIEIDMLARYVARILEAKAA